MRPIPLFDPSPILERTFWALLVVIWTVLIMALLSSPAISPARAVNGGRYAESAVSDWFRSLHDRGGVPCCDTADGTRLEDPDWEFNGASYRVRIDGDWLSVPSDAVLTGVNRVGYAVVWRFKDFTGRTHIRCFLPGSAT